MAGVYPGVGQRCGKEGLALYFSFSNQHTRDHQPCAYCWAERPNANVKRT
jgi:hypothetical protein